MIWIWFWRVWLSVFGLGFYHLGLRVSNFNFYFLIQNREWRLLSDMVVIPILYESTPRKNCQSTPIPTCRYSPSHSFSSMPCLVTLKCIWKMRLKLGHFCQGNVSAFWLDFWVLYNLLLLLLFLLFLCDWTEMLESS